MSSIPTFPSFSKLHLNHREAIERIISTFPPYSDFNFTSLWSYDTEELCAVSLLNNNLVVQFSDYIDNKPFLSFLGTKNVESTIDTLLNFSFKSEKLLKYLKLVPHHSIEVIKNKNGQYEILEDNDNHDYILSIQDMAELKGGKYYDKRNLVNRFNKKYPHIQSKILNISDTHTQKQMIELFLHWAKQKKRKVEETETEKRAILRLFALSPHIRCFAIGLFDNARMIGFATYELAHDLHGVMSFEKGDITYDGIYSVLNHETSKHLHKLGFKYLNYEQDLGIPGLKQAKRLWRPIHHLKKYIIKKR